MIEREWREAADLQPMRMWLAVTLAAAAILRFWSLGAGIPYAVGVDEPEVMDRVINMMKSGSLHPGFFDYPGLVFYIQLPIAILRFMLGAVRGEWRSLAEVGPAEFYLWARAVTAALGTATVFLVYLAGLRWGGRHALLGAALLAVMPIHVRESHFVLTDVPMTFFVTLTWVLSMAAHERGTARSFALAGMTAGLAMSCRYTAGVAILLPLIAVWMTVPTQPSRLTAALATVGCWLGAFLLTSPYTLLDLPDFLNAFANLVGHFQPRSRQAEAGWLIYLKHLRNNLQWPAMLLLVSGLVLAAVRAVRGPSRVKWTLLCVFPVVFVWTIADSAQIFARYLMPIVPFVCLIIGIAVVSGVSLLRRFSIPRAARTLLIVALTVAAILPPARIAVQFTRSLGQASTQEAAWRWIDANIPRGGSSIVLEKYDLRLPPERYRIRHVNKLVDQALNTYRADGVRYLIATSQVYGPMLQDNADAETSGAYRMLFRSTRELIRISPDTRHPGPELRILLLE